MKIGANALYWVETDKIRESPEYVPSIKRLHLQMMRFPGGEVADNYEWRDNSLQNPKRWPYQRHRYDIIHRMDFNEFIRLQRTIGSEPIVVVNLEGGFVEGDLEKAADLAAEWVYYANIVMGYNVKYWEIGNESYLPQTTYPLRAIEYAEAFNLFASKMKSVDKTIKLGAIGPFRYSAVSVNDRLSEEQLRKLRNYGKDEKRHFLKTLRLTGKLKRNPQKSWWKIVFRQCRKNIDFIALHKYLTRKHHQSNEVILSNLKKDTNSFYRNIDSMFVENKPDIFITEFNIYKNESLYDIQTINLLKSSLKLFEDKGISSVIFWPLHDVSSNKKHIPGFSKVLKYLQEGKLK